mmetsp:Transcript_5532/g.3893  ORF Transcript_5532/g.3893 Transcript_5532/m.3893 type:complete len:109 (+) Transcript_5532:26-352(+)
MSASIYNFAHPLRKGHIRLADSGRELFGTVIKQGVNDKTVTVRVSRYGFNHKIGIWFSSTKNFHCHDEENYCRTGDKVVIRTTRKISPIKHFYVRNIVRPAGRQVISD